MFDMAGTLAGVSDKAGMLGKEDHIPHAKQTLVADSVGTTVGAVLVAGTVIICVEYASGVAGTFCGESERHFHGDDCPGRALHFKIFYLIEEKTGSLM